MLQPVKTPCSHIFCSECIHEALQRVGLCPLCRQRVEVDDLREVPHPAAPPPPPAAVPAPAAAAAAAAAGGDVIDLCDSDDDGADAAADALAQLNVGAREQRAQRVHVEMNAKINVRHLCCFALLCELARMRSRVRPRVVR